MPDERLKQRDIKAVRNGPLDAALNFRWNSSAYFVQYKPVQGKVYRFKRETMHLDHQFKYAELAEERRHNEVQETIDAEAAKQQALTDRATAVAAAANPQPTGAQAK